MNNNLSPQRKKKFS